MALFRCLVLGENFVVLDERGERKLMGFYATRFVHASDEADAELLVLQKLKDDEWLQSLKDNRESCDPVAMIYFQEIVEVEKIAGSKEGFTFFEMENGANKSESECTT